MKRFGTSVGAMAMSAACALFLRQTVAKGGRLQNALAAACTSASVPGHVTATRAYHEKVIDHYENPRNVGSFDKKDPKVGTGLVGAPACGDVMKLQIRVRQACASLSARASPRRAYSDLTSPLRRLTTKETSWTRASKPSGAARPSRAAAWQQSGKNIARMRVSPPAPNQTRSCSAR